MGTMGTMGTSASSLTASKDETCPYLCPYPFKVWADLLIFFLLLLFSMFHGMFHGCIQPYTKSAETP